MNEKCSVDTLCGHSSSSPFSTWVDAFKMLRARQNVKSLFIFVTNYFISEPEIRWQPSVQEEFSMIGQQLTPVNKKKSFNYSGDLKFDHLKLRNIWNPDFFKNGFQRSGFSLSNIKHGPNSLKIDHSKSQHFCPDFKWFLTKWWQFVQISDG